MDEIPPFIALPLNLSNLVIEESVYATCVDTGLDLIATTSKNLCSELPMTKLSLLPLTLENKNSSLDSVLRNGVVSQIVSSCNKPKDGEDNSLFMTRPDGLCIENCIDSHISQSIKRSESWISTIASEVVDDLLSLQESDEGVRIKEPKRKFSTSLLEVSEEMKINKPKTPSNLPPLWGLTSIRGRRAEMEDSAIALPRLLKIPPQMLSDNPIFSSVHKDLTADVFGVYDGHGGSQVANYCWEHLHISLTEEISLAKENLRVESGEHTLKEKWLKIFYKCFHRLDNEVGGFTSDGDISDLHEPIAPESVGSTAVVAIVCSTHIIVANCGDSRAVLNRGKAPMPLSIDHKPNREDECARIEAAGGKVINWDGYRISGVLAVSRSIGDRYLRPYVVADPEIMFVSRTKEDECLILASDGLWDVITNEEACDLVWKRILLWHKKNGATLNKE